MNKIINSLIVSATIFASSNINAQNNNGDLLPCQNLGLNNLTSAIVQTQEDVEKLTGFKPFFDYYGVFLANTSGGLEQSSDYTHIMIFGIEGDLERELGWKGASFVVSGAYNTGNDLSKKIGNFFTVSESSITDGVMLYEIYLKQDMQFGWGDSATLTLGRMSMADVFGTLPAFGYLVSGGINGTPAAMFSNSPYTSATIASWGIAVEYNTIENLSFATGLYQVQQEAYSAGWRGTDLNIDKDDGYMMMFQASWSPTLFCDSEGRGGLSGTYQIGGWFYSGYDMNYLNGSGSIRDNGYGFYAQAQQQVWVDKTEPYKSISIWGGVQYAPIKTISTMPVMLYCGAEFRGFVPYRENDAAYVSILNGWFSSDLKEVQDATYETSIELTYVIQLNENVSIQPDLQYIIRPYGNADIDDALVVGCQMLVSF